MAEQPPTTPATAPPRAEVDPAFTRQLAPSSPLNLAQSKRLRPALVRPPERMDNRKSSGPDNAAQEYLTTHLDKMMRQANIQKDVLSKLGNTLDTFVASFDGDSRTEHRHQARSLVNQLLQHVNLLAFSSSEGQVYAPFRVASTQPSSVPDLPGVPRARKAASATSSSSKNVTWAEVVSRPASERSMPIITKKKPEPRDKRATAREDHRILVALDRDSDGESGGPPRGDGYRVRHKIATLFNLSLGQIPEVNPTKTGYAIIPADKDTRDLLLTDSAKQLLMQNLGAREVTIPEKWWTYAVPEVPWSFDSVTPDPTPMLAQDLIDEEVRIQAGLNPVRCTVSRHGIDPATNRGTWLVSFLKPVKPFKIFGTSGLARLVEKRPRIERHNPGCQGYCNPARCTRVDRCPRCSDPMRDHQTAGPCTAPLRCANCHGPFEPGHTDCPAAPRYEKGRLVRPTKAEQRNIRRRGVRAYARVNAETSDRPPSDAPAQGHSGVNEDQAAEAGPRTEDTIVARPLEQAHKRRRSGTTNAGPQPTPDTPTDPSARPTRNGRVGALLAPGRASRSTANRVDYNVANAFGALVDLTDADSMQEDEL
jgi:hypothetical protein